MEFINMSDDEIDKLLVCQQAEMDASGLNRGDILAAVQSGKAVIERSSYGVAVINPLRTSPDFKLPFLWLLYLPPDNRGQGHGRKFVRQILKKYADTHFMRLHAFGPRRSKFFSRFGFRVVERDNETGLRTMEQR